MIVQDLPPEILQNIFSKLSTKDFKDNVRLVCRRWYKLAQLETIILNPPTNDKFKDLSIYLEKNPSFASSIKELELINNQCIHTGNYHKEKVVIPSLYYPTDKKNVLSTFFKRCSDLRELVLYMDCIQEISDYLNQVLEVARYNKLKLRCLDVTVTAETDEPPIPHSTLIEFALNHLFTCFNPELRRFSASEECGRYWCFFSTNDGEEGSSNLASRKRSINFIYKDIGNNNATVLLEELIIAGSYYTISRELLKYVISGKLPHLKFLEIDSKVLDCPGEHEDNIWNELRDYCESSIEEYKITIKNKIGDNTIFTLYSWVKDYPDSMISNEDVTYPYEIYYYQDSYYDDEEDDYV